jgi:RNA polymerase sigma-70 factor (ECF subfamily)
MTSLALADTQHAIIDLMPDLRRFARSLTRSADTADDLVQAAYARALSNPQALAAVEELASWMRIIIRNLWIDEKRSARDHLSVPLEAGEHVGTEDTERALIVRSTLTKVRTVIASLPEEQRSAIMLVCVSGLSYKEVAAKLDVPIGTLMSRLCRARLELARRMSPFSQQEANWERVPVTRRKRSSSIDLAPPDWINR